MRLVGPNATRMDITEIRVADGIFRRKAAITDSDTIKRLKAVSLQECRVKSGTCCMSSKRWSLVVRRGTDVIANYEVRSGVVFDGAKPIGCLPDDASALVSERLSRTESERVNPLEEIAVLT